MTLEAAVEGVMDAIQSTLQGVSPQVRVTKFWEGSDGGTLPAACVLAPVIQDGGERVITEFGGYGHLLTFSVEVAWDFDNALKAQAACLEWVTRAIPALRHSSAIKALCEDRPLIGEVTPELEQGQSNGVFTYSLEISTAVLVES